MSKDVVQHQQRARVPGLWDWLESGWPTALRLLEPERWTRVEEYVLDDRLVVRTELPGIDPDKDVEITLSGGLLTIHGERREEHRDNGRSEFSYGAFSRSVALPNGADEDDVTATYQDGILEVSIKVHQAKPEAKRIPVGKPG